MSQTQKMKIKSNLHRNFITVEGGEGAGKSTLIQALSLRLQERGYDCMTTREPGGVQLAEKVRELLLDPTLEIGPQAELFLFLASRSEHVEKRIAPALQEGKIVLCDRFNHSTIAYQGIARGLGEEFVRESCVSACHGVLPSLTLLLHLPHEIGFSRITRTKDRMEEQGEEFYKKVSEGLLNLAEQESDRFAVIDATLSKEEVLELAEAACLAHLEQVEHV